MPFPTDVPTMEEIQQNDDENENEHPQHDDDEEEEQNNNNNEQQQQTNNNNNMLSVAVAQPLQPPIDYGSIKHLMSNAELAVQQTAVQLSNTENALLTAQSNHDGAKLAHTSSLQHLDELKLQFRSQIMDEGLRQPCRWNEMYSKLLMWKAQHDGDTIVPCDAKNSSEEVKKLNRWVVNQRSAYKYFCNGDKKHIKDYRVDALNKIGFVWSVNDQLWNENFEELRKFHTEHGNYNPTHKQNRKLAQFVSRLRTAMSHKENGLVQQELTDDRINRLNSINFTWEMKRKPRKTTTNNTVKFDIMYEHLVSFKETYGHLKVNKMEKEWKKGIGAPKHKVFRRLPLFVAFVRKEQLAFMQGQPSCALDEEKIRLLTELGLEWRMPPSQPRKSTGGESTRKKRKGPPMEEEETMLQQQVGGEGVMDVHDNHDAFGDGSGYHYPPQEMMEGVEAAAAAAAAAAHTFAPPPLAEPKTEETSEV